VRAGNSKQDIVALESPRNELTLREQPSRDGLFTCLFKNGTMREGAESERAQ